VKKKVADTAVKAIHKVFNLGNKPKKGKKK